MIHTTPDPNYLYPILGCSALLTSSLEPLEIIETDSPNSIDTMQSLRNSVLRCTQSICPEATSYT
jgi:hypothetical protein